MKKNFDKLTAAEVGDSSSSLLPREPNSARDPQLTLGQLHTLDLFGHKGVRVATLEACLKVPLLSPSSLPLFACSGRGHPRWTLFLRLHAPRSQQACNEAKLRKPIAVELRPPRFPHAASPRHTPTMAGTCFPIERGRAL
jgi:hypothetical protein